MTSRRNFLIAAGAGGAVVLGGGLALRSCDSTPPSLPGERPRCVPKASMALHNTIGSAPLIYEVNQARESFGFNSGFHGQLENWLAAWRTGSGALGGVTAIDTYGAWTDGGGKCSSWHNSGRAFDIARLRNGKQTLVSCRQDLWASLPATQMVAHRRAYWRLAAHLHAHFAYVLTYLFDDLHRNHIHFDNGVSGAGRPSFNTGSRVQNQAIQACCSYLWKVPCDITGKWDPATKKASRQVLERIGASGSMTAGGNWQRFMNATAAHEDS